MSVRAPSAVYDLIGALVEQLPGAVPDGVVVYDGFPTGEGYAAEWVLIGVEDPMIRGAATSATTQQEWASIGANAREETGEITCAASSWNGNADPKLARARVAEITSSIEMYLRENYDLGLSQYAALWTGYGSRTALRQAQDDKGAEALVVFTIAFTARI